jgi:hypothetical protein
VSAHAQLSAAHLARLDLRCPLALPAFRRAVRAGTRRHLARLAPDGPMPSARAGRIVAARERQANGAGNRLKWRVAGRSAGGEEIYLPCNLRNLPARGAGLAEARRGARAHMRRRRGSRGNRGAASQDYGDNRGAPAEGKKSGPPGGGGMGDRTLSAAWLCVGEHRRSDFPPLGAAFH